MSRVAEISKISGLCLLLGLIGPVTVLADSLSIRVGQGNDDAEERTNDGSMYLNSSDLELINDLSAGDQVVGIRFLNVTIPAGATINSAYLDFIVDETSSTTTSVTLRGEDSDNPGTFTSTTNDISNRTPTTAAVAWNSIPAWNTVGATQTTPDLAAIVQEIVDRGGWSSGNAMVFIVTGSGTRIAESYDGVPGSAPLLRVDYTSADTGPPAAVTNLAAGSTTSSSVQLTWTAPGDDGSSGTATTYDIRYSTSSITAANWGAATQATGEPSPQTAGSSESFTVPGLLTGTTYYFAIKTADEVPQWSSLSNVISAATAAGSYPSSNGTDNSYEWITNVSLAAINNSTGQESGGYTDYTAQIADVVQGTSVSLSVTINPDSREYIYAWIDWNRDYDFTDAGEEYVLATNVSSAGPHSLSVSVPVSALTGTTRMRVSLKYNGVPQSDETLQYGEVEDYSVRVSAAGAGIKGKVVEDINGDGDLGDSVGHANVAVRLYLDGGDGLPNGNDDTAQASTVTAVDGSYSFAGVAAGVYWVTVDSRTLPPNGSFNGGFDQGDVWAEQTYGPIGGLSDNGAGGYTELVAAGACYGGRRTEQSDNAGTLDTSEHLAKVTVSAAEVGNIDFGFSFNVITRTEDGDDDGGADRTVQGSLRQFIQNSNAIVGANSSYFVIPTHDSGYDFGGHGEYRIQPTSELPTLTDLVTIDGTTQTGFVDRPLVELDGSSAGSVHGLNLQADNITIRGLVIHSFTVNGIVLIGASDCTIAGNYIGVDVTGSVDMGNASHGISIVTSALDNTIGGTGAADANVISGNGGSGININSGSHGNVVIGNIVGLDVTGTSTIANSHGINIGLASAVNNTTIGGTTTAERNIVSGNNQQGVYLTYGTGNVIQGNYIGTDISGTLARGNGNDGIHLRTDANGNTIGGTTADARNLISGNAGAGIMISGVAATGNVVVGNFIGTDVTGMLDLGNAAEGVRIELSASGNTIGGLTSAHRNVISGNDLDGIRFVNSADNLVVGNHIGVDAAGTGELGNTECGVRFNAGATGNTVGGGTAAERNVISGNVYAGVRFSATGTSGNQVQGNFIGTDVNGTLDLGNTDFGVIFDNGASDNVIGGTTGGEGNLIVFNGDGVRVAGGVSNSDNNAFLGNSIHANVNLGIDLGSTAGLTTNDADDLDIGPNELLNYPVITNVVQDGANLDVTIAVDLPAGWYRIEFFENPDGNDANGFGEGQTFLGAASIQTTGAVGDETFAVTLNSVTPTQIQGTTATTTEDTSGGAGTTFGSTSEFGPAYAKVGVLVVDTSADYTAPDARYGDTSSIAALLSDKGTDGLISLREAITACDNTANDGSLNEIFFDIAGAGPHTIQPIEALPTITDPVIIDGTTEPDFSSTPIIELDGSLAGANISGLNITAGGSTIRGLVINRFTGSGIRLVSLGSNTIVGNYIGPDAGGVTGGVGNFVEGIYIYQSPNNVIGGTTDADRNVISGNRLRGIWINEVDDGAAASSSGTQIRGNYIGTNADGNDKLPYSGGGSPAYQQMGIAFWDAIGNTIGGTAPGAENVISGNSWYGIYFWGPNSDGNLVQGNIIGLDEAAASPIGNGWDSPLRSGVYISNAPGNTIGGNVAGASNIIAGNDASGIVVFGTSATGNAIWRNSIYDNAALGIDLGAADGVTPNDAGDGDTGGNNLQNFPVLTSAVSNGGNLTVQGTLSSTPNTEFSIAFFANSALDPSGNGEGKIYLDTAKLTTDGSGNLALDHTMPIAVSSGDYITATATAPDNSTSEFSAGEMVVGSADVSLTKSDSDDPAASGGALLYTLLVTNNGPDTATGVTVVDSLPGGVTMQSVTVSQGTWSGTSVITCNLGAILNGGTATIEILVVPSGTGTITNVAHVSTNDVDGVPGNNSDSETTEIIAGGTTDIPLTLYRRIHGFIDFTTTGATLRTESNGGDPCAVTNTAAATLSGIPATGTVNGAYLYWAASGSVIDADVTLDGNAITADRTWQSTFVLGATSYDFFGAFKDVTTEVQTKGNGLYTFSGLTIDNGSPFCASAAVMGGWSLVVVYADPALSGKTLVIYDGFDLERNGSTSYVLSGIYAADPPEAKTAFLVWEGDDTLGGTTESLEFNGSAQSDAWNPANNVYNGTINTQGVNNSYGLDLDTFDVSSLVNFGDTFASTTLLTGPDLVILNAVVLEAKTNVIAGTVFEDVNYGGGPGRDLAAASADAPSFAVGRPNATVELYDAAGNLFRSTTTSANGAYGFTGLADGTYYLRVPNGTVTSSRGGATGSEWPVQTYRTNGSSGASVAVTDEVGGADPSVQDDPINGASADLSDITAQSVTEVLLSNSMSVTSADFGFNFDTIVNSNDSGQGSLRQFVDNSNALQNTTLDQDGLTLGMETSVFQIPTTDTNYNRTGNGEYSILPDSALTTITDPVIVTGSTQPGFAGTPIIELDGTNAGAGAAGLTFTAGGSTVQSLAINRYANGIILNGSDATTVLSCYLGTDVTGSVNQGNSERGVWIRSGTDDTMIGGTAAGEGNLIAFNGTDGIGLEAGAGTGNAILGNSIHDSGDLAIDLTEDGFTDNDPLDADLGENNLQNFPVVTFAQYDGANLIIRGSLSSEANTAYRVEFFVNQTVDPSGYGEGETYLVHTDLTTDGSGDVSFDLSFPLAVTPGNYISATATDPGNSTSEFGANTIVLGLPDILLVKSVATLSDPVNGGTNPKAVPGAVMLYTVTASNQGDGTVDADSVVIRDAVPANSGLNLNDIDTPGSGPILFTDGTTASGLSYTFTSLASTTDDLAFSNDGGVTFTYTPVPDAAGYDAQVTHFRVKPGGVFAGSDGTNHPTFSLKFKTRVE